MEETREPVIQVKNLYKVFRVGNEKVRALNGVDMTIYKGEFCAIVGTSGSGKSTMLNMLAGLEKPTKGEVIIAGQHLEKMNENQLVRFRREKVGFIFQSFNLLGTMNAIENVALPLTFRGVNKKVREERAVKMLKLVGLPKHMKHRPNEMSGGQQQRVAIARSLIYRPDLLLADEPTGNLDRQNSREVIDMLKLSNRNMHQTILLITHDEKTALEADRVVMIEDGRIISDVRREGKTLSDTRQG